MSISLLELANGRVSLEFEESDFSVIVKTIRDIHGVPNKTLKATYTEYQFEGSRFLFQNEWEEPCLISTSAKGDAILRFLAEQIET